MQLNTVAYAERKSILPKNIFLACIYIIILVFLATGILSFISAYKITHPSKVETPQITSNIAPNYKNISFYTGGEAEDKINGWFFPSGTSKTSVLLVHGYGKNRLQFNEETFKLISQFTNKDINVLTIDLRGSGNSSGSINTFGKNETADILSSIKYLKQIGTDRIILMGFSTGASSCLSAVSETPYRDSIIGVIGDSPYSTVDNYTDYLINSSSLLSEWPFKYTIKFCVNKLSKVTSDLDIIPKIPALIPTPVFLIDGAQEDIPASDNTKLLYEMYYRKSPVPAYYWNSGAQEYCNSFLEYPEQYMDKVMDFINKCIKKADMADKN
ncbi:serine aminopeptidase S33 family [Ruminiclostridium sufflavum DSM 19573]|uniref:Serine aminopeptidase S33 family n=1 Tax=Ruminiclostridium sufflavum DSM 19573 TaxID=1121337 RepID=A0A318XPM0_9FIRM|nr:alpha/beta hydrolase [Ruminiclostridium sufflavum]PYG89130.1 serine aminopeptidase S33 family [Ruminiclostridium sufflavum DSM 19573]